MPKRVLCKFFAHGACLKGEHCEFSHDWKAPPNNICTFYQKGICAYASRCRYEHVKVSRLQSSVSYSAADPSLPSSFPVECPPGTATYEADMSTVPPSLPPSFPVEWAPGTATYEADMSTVLPSFPVEWSPGIATYEADMPTATNGQFNPPTRPAWGGNSGHHNVLESDDDFGYLRSVDPAADQSICSFAAAGDCPRGNKCPHIHGDLCPTCGKHCLHPFRPLEREEHMKTCEKRQKHLEALRHSQEIECSVCLERVLSKTKSAERKFGILSECNHPFCISCIRNWRGSSPASGLDVNSALRACPICRKLSYFVIPSVIWYSSKEEKQEIVDSYKAKLKSIDCKHFDFGNGTCPFGTSCFYKHSYRDGSLEEVVLRHLGAEDGNTVIAKNIRLSDFLSNLQIR